MKNKIKKTIRLIVIGVTAVILLAFVASFIDLVSEWMDEKNRGKNIESYDYYLQDHEYGKLKDRLETYNPQGEAFKMYWDVADAYRCYTVYEFWTDAERTEGVSAEDDRSAKEYARNYRERLQQIYDDSGEKAKRYIEDFAGDLIR